MSEKRQRAKPKDETRRGSARMVDISGKSVTERTATAVGIVHISPETMKLIEGGLLPKGNVFDVARVAGIMAAKRTPELLPMCHAIILDDINVAIETAGDDTVRIRATVKAEAKTGVEMEALAATAVAALTVYDMCKGVDRNIRVTDIRLVQKSGGRSGDFVAEND